MSGRASQTFQKGTKKFYLVKPFLALYNFKMKKNILYKPPLVAPLSLLVINSSPTPPRAVHPHRTPSSIFATESGAPDTLGVSASE